MRKHKYQTLLHHYTLTKSLSDTKTLHSHIITSGLLFSHISLHIPSLISMAYAACGHIPYARKVFGQINKPNLLNYNALVKASAQHRMFKDCLQVFSELMRTGFLRPDRYTFPYVVKVCGDLSALNMGFAIHGLVVSNGIRVDTFLGNSLVAMYMKCGNKEMARRVFDNMEERSVVSWNTMISGYFCNGSFEEALSIFEEMVRAGVDMDSASVVSVLPSCGRLEDLEFGKKVHRIVEERDLAAKIAVKNALLDMYVRCGDMAEARLLFDTMGERDVITWTTMIHGFILNGDITNGIQLFTLMQYEGVRPNEATIVSLMRACTNLSMLKNGMCLHGWALRKNIETDVLVVTSLISMYAKCSRIQASYRVFANTLRKLRAPWNAMLSGLVHNKLPREAIMLFKEMISEAVGPECATLNSLLPAYAMLADMHQGINIHGYLISSGFFSSVEVSTGLIDVYSKCGYLEFAHKIFNGISRKDRDIFCWSAIISGYGMHGNGEVAVSLFHEMVQLGIEPNEVTLISVFHACSHSGLVDEGLELFTHMLKFHKNLAQPNHYTCAIDLLGRADRLEEAYELIRAMPFEPNHAVWGALLGACVVHENVELGEIAAKKLYKLEPENTGSYVLMGKIYSAVGRWRDAERIREMIDEIGLRKLPAQSFIEVRNM